MKNDITFGASIKKLRQEKNLTLKEVATAIKIDISTLGKLEKNQRKPSKLIIQELAHFFHIDKNELILSYLSDSIASKILKEDIESKQVLEVAEQKIEYLKLNNKL